jgi:hypothetical protein
MLAGMTAGAAALAEGAPAALALLRLQPAPQTSRSGRAMAMKRSKARLF